MNNWASPGTMVRFYVTRTDGTCKWSPAVVVACDKDGIATLNVFTDIGCLPERSVPHSELVFPPDRTWTFDDDTLE